MREEREILGPSVFVKLLFSIFVSQLNNFHLLETIFTLVVSLCRSVHGTIDIFR